MKLKSKYKNGFIALTLALSVMGTLLSFIFLSGIETGHFFDQAIHKEYRVMNSYFANNCIDQAILSLAHDYFFSITEPIEMTNLFCTILSLKKDSSSIHTIETRGDYMKNYVYRKGVVRVHDDHVEIISLN